MLLYFKSLVVITYLHLNRGLVGLGSNRVTFLSVCISMSKYLGSERTCVLAGVLNLGKVLISCNVVIEDAILLHFYIYHLLMNMLKSPAPRTIGWGPPEGLNFLELLVMYAFVSLEVKRCLCLGWYNTLQNPLFLESCRCFYVIVCIILA